MKVNVVNIVIIKILISHFENHFLFGNIFSFFYVLVTYQSISIRGLKKQKKVFCILLFFFWGKKRILYSQTPFYIFY